MTITIQGTPKEIAALTVQLQERQAENRGEICCDGVRYARKPYSMEYVPVHQLVRNEDTDQPER